jgi:EpsI family protein
MLDIALGSMRFLHSGPARLVTLILLVEIALFYKMPTAEHIPSPPPLSSFQHDVGGWKMAQEMEIDSDTESLLRADDTLSRAYVGPAGALTFFVAFFKSQRGGVTPHSPKICLPGAGWTPEGSRTMSVSVPGETRPIPVNRYIVRHGGDRSLVLYWYATAHHVIADEYLSKLYVMYEGLRYRRSDEAVYRVIVPITQGEGAAETAAVGFIQASYRPLKRQMWSNI